MRSLYLTPIKRQSKVLGEEKKALVIMDVFTRLVTFEVKEMLEGNNILLTNAPANLTRFY